MSPLFQLPCNEAADRVHGTLLKRLIKLNLGPGQWEMKMISARSDDEEEDAAAAAAVRPRSGKVSSQKEINGRGRRNAEF